MGTARFRYCADPLFLSSLGAYVLNRVVLRAVWPAGFFHAHFNDVICMAMWVPVVLLLQRRLGLRTCDEPPRAVEISVILITWSALFEVYLPRTALGAWCVADYRDVLWYALGALAAALFWERWYAPAGADAPSR